MTGRSAAAAAGDARTDDMRTAVLSVDTTATRRRRANRPIFLPTGRRCSQEHHAGPRVSCRRPHPATWAVNFLQLLDRCVPEDEALDPVLAAEVDGGGGLLAGSVDRHDRTEAERVMGHPVAGGQGGHRAVAR